MPLLLISKTASGKTHVTLNSENLGISSYRLLKRLFQQIFCCGICCELHREKNVAAQDNGALTMVHQAKRIFNVQCYRFERKGSRIKSKNGIT
jgi:hypothetical protein